MQIWISISQEVCLAPPVMWDIKHEGQILIGARALEPRHEKYSGMEVPLHTVLTSVLDEYAGYGVIG